MLSNLQGLSPEAAFVNFGMVGVGIALSEPTCCLFCGAKLPIPLRNNRF
jgi:hypothetical protein